jgi:hypothetical protein
MIQVYVFPKEYKPRGSRYLVSFHLSGREIRNLCLLCVTLTFTLATIRPGIESVYPGFALAFLIFLAVQIRSMDAINVPPDIASRIVTEIKSGGSMMIGTQFGTMKPDPVEPNR